MLMPFNSTYCANKTIVVVRNPLDAFDSFANLANTMSHGVKTNYEYYEEYPEWWTWWVKTQTRQFKQYFDGLFKDLRGSDRASPLYIVRYEDLVMTKKETLIGLFSFLLSKEDLKGTNAERRIDHVV